jgi:hypothetical protein
VRIASCWVHPGSPCCPLTLFAHLHFLWRKDLQGGRERNPSIGLPIPLTRPVGLSSLVWVSSSIFTTVCITLILGAILLKWVAGLGSHFSKVLLGPLYQNRKRKRQR